MGYASKAGRARISASNPEAIGVCFRCGIWYSRNDLRFQWDWRGAALQNLYVLVCPDCYDTPQQQLRSIVLPPDPVPIEFPSIEYFLQDETNYRYTSGQNTTDPITGIPVPGGDLRITEDDNQRVTIQTGEAPGGLNQLPGTDPTVPDSIGSDDPGLPLGTDEIPDTGPLT